LVDVHGGVRAADVRRFAGEAVQRIALGHRAIPVCGDVDGLDVDALWGRPVQLIRGVTVRGGGGLDVFGDRDFRRRFAVVLAVQWYVGEAAYSSCCSHVMPPIG
jgi:hypothetical protein